MQVLEINRASILVKLTLMVICFTVLYFGGAIVGFKYFLPELIFIKSADIKSSESIRYSINSSSDETIIRLYGDPLNRVCAIFFPGQHGGILRYEQEIFENFSVKNVAVYALSYPGYEGAAGNSTFISVLTSTIAAIRFIDSNTSCKIEQVIYVGRSLGASIALLSANKLKPKGILLDSVGLSVSRAIRVRLAQNIFLKPLNILPIEKILELNYSLRSSFATLSDVPIRIFQGENDSMASVDEIMSVSAKYSNVKIYAVPNATHSDTHILAGEKYYRKFFSLAR